jgi:hypothetical protein
MSDREMQKESFEEFKNSFSYGSRNDLNFKFLKALDDAEAARFFQELLRKLGECLDDGEWDRLVTHLVEWQTEGYSDPGRFAYDNGPFVATPKPLSESKLALITSTGHFVEGDDPKPFGVSNMTNEEAIRRIGDFLKAEPRLSVIPTDTPPEKLRVRHGGYDTHGARADHNAVLPLEPLKELARRGAIGELADEAYSFVGACAQTRMLKQTGPRWVSMLAERAVDTVLLVPV